MIDYHTHHRRCGHAVGELEEYVQQAIALGLTEIGLSDHQPVLHLQPPDLLPEVAMDYAELPHYVEEVLRLKSQYQAQITIRLGLEADYVAGWTEETRKLLQEYPFDYVIGSVHFLGSWDLTDSRQIEKWKSRDVWDTYAEYFQAYQEAAQSGLFDILGHLDVVKRFRFQPERDWTPLIDRTVEVMANSGVAAEINTSGLRYPCEEAFPAPDTLRKLVAAKVPITIGSDAHRPDHVAKDFQKGLEIFQGVGGTEIIGFEQRKPYIAFRL